MRLNYLQFSCYYIKGLWFGLGYYYNQVILDVESSGKWSFPLKFFGIDLHQWFVTISYMATCKCEWISCQIKPGTLPSGGSIEKKHKIYPK